MSVVCRKLSQLLSEVLITSFRRPDENAWMPTKRISLTPVFPPSLISNTRSTRLFGSSMIFGSTRHVETAAAVIDLDDALHVGLHGRPRQRPARLRLNFGLELFVLGLLVALEGDPIDHRVLDHVTTTTGRRHG